MNLPPALQLVWACAGIGAFLGGAVWLIFYARPFMRNSLGMMAESLRLMKESIERGEKTADRIEKLIEKGVKEEKRNVLKNI